MITDRQVRRLFKLLQTEKNFGIASAKAGMDEKTARKYKKACKLPSELKKDHSWRTRPDPFAEVWPGIKEKLELNPGLEAITLFEDLQRRYQGRFQDGQLRTFQRKIKIWRGTKGPSKEVFFSQKHHPGRLGQSDFTHMNPLGITIGGLPFNHLIYHFVLTYSNWETGSICFSESFEALSEGLQNALWQLGGVPEKHQTDCLTTAVHKTGHPEVFTSRYKDLLNHYRLSGSKTNPGRPNENGDVEQRHYRFKRAVEQSLLLRGSHDFESRNEYKAFLEKLLKQLNSGRRERFLEELAVLKRLPECRLEACKRLNLKVGTGSTVRVNNNTYSVDSRLIRERVEVRLYMDHLEVWFGQKKVNTLPRLKGEGNVLINYRHIIDSLVRKPGAFENYRHKEELFPTVRFRIAYDQLKRSHLPRAADKQYLKILYLAARESETKVDDALRMMIDQEESISYEKVHTRIHKGQVKPITQIHISPVDLTTYDDLLKEVVS